MSDGEIVEVTPQEGEPHAWSEHPRHPTRTAGRVAPNYLDTGPSIRPIIVPRNPRSRSSSDASRGSKTTARRSDMTSAESPRGTRADSSRDAFVAPPERPGRASSVTSSERSDARVHRRRDPGPNPKWVAPTFPKAMLQPGYMGLTEDERRRLLADWVLAHEARREEAEEVSTETVAAVLGDPERLPVHPGVRTGTPVPPARSDPVPTYEELEELEVEEMEDDESIPEVRGTVMTGPFVGHQDPSVPDQPRQGEREGTVPAHRREGTVPAVLNEQDRRREEKARRKAEKEQEKKSRREKRERDRVAREQEGRTRDRNTFRREEQGDYREPIPEVETSAGVCSGPGFDSLRSGIPQVVPRDAPRTNVPPPVLASGAQLSGMDIDLPPVLPSTETDMYGHEESEDFAVNTPTDGTAFVRCCRVYTPEEAKNEDERAGREIRKIMREERDMFVRNSDVYSDFQTRQTALARQALVLKSMWTNSTVLEILRNQPGDGFDWDNEWRFRIPGLQSGVWFESYLWSLRPYGFKLWAYDRALRCCVAPNIIDFALGPWSKLCEVLRTSRSDKPTPSCPPLSGSDYDAPHSGVSRPSRLMHWMKQVAGTSDEKLREFDLIPRLWAKIPDAYILACSPLFWKVHGLHQDRVELPPGPGKWSLHTRFHDLWYRVEKTPREFWDRWKYELHRVCRIAAYGMYIDNGLDPETAMVVQLGCLIRMTWYLAMAQNTSWSLFHDRTLDMPVYAADHQGDRIDYGIITAGCLSCGDPRAIVGHVTGFRSKAGWHINGTCCVRADRNGRRIDSGNVQRIMYGNHCLLVVHHYIAGIRAAKAENVKSSEYAVQCLTNVVPMDFLALELVRSFGDPEHNRPPGIVIQDIEKMWDQCKEVQHSWLSDPPSREFHDNDDNRSIASGPTGHGRGKGAGKGKGLRPSYSEDIATSSTSVEDHSYGKGKAFGDIVRGAYQKGYGPVKGKGGKSQVRTSRSRSRSTEAPRRWRSSEPTDDSTPMDATITTPKCSRSCVSTASWVHACQGRGKHGEMTRELILLCDTCMKKLSGLCLQTEDRSIVLRCRHCRRHALFAPAEELRKTSSVTLLSETRVRKAGGRPGSRPFLREVNEEFEWEIWSVLGEAWETGKIPDLLRDEHNSLALAFGKSHPEELWSAAELRPEQLDRNDDKVVGDILRNLVRVYWDELWLTFVADTIFWTGVQAKYLEIPFDRWIDLQNYYTPEFVIQTRPGTVEEVSWWRQVTTHGCGSLLLTAPGGWPDDLDVLEEETETDPYLWHYGATRDVVGELAPARAWYRYLKSQSHETPAEPLVEWETVGLWRVLWAAIREVYRRVQIRAPEDYLPEDAELM